VFQKQKKLLKNVEYFNYLGSVITYDARHTREIESRIATAAAIKQKTLHLQTKCKEETSKVLNLEHNSLLC
jgi:hypothetical protein